jgi:hypothetical protein
MLPKFLDSSLGTVAGKEPRRTFIPPGELLGNPRLTHYDLILSIHALAPVFRFPYLSIQPAEQVLAAA